MSVVEAPSHLLEHPAFRGLERQWFEVPGGFMMSAIGQKFRLDHDESIDIPERRVARKHCPIFPWGYLNEEIFEWIALAEAVREAQDRFIMIELGAGFAGGLSPARC